MCNQNNPCNHCNHSAVACQVSNHHGIYTHLDGCIPTTLRQYMARLSKEAEKKIDMIVRMASAQAHTELGKLYSLSRKINVLVKQELKESKTNRAKLRRASSEANSMWLKCATIYNKVYKEGARGLEVHAALKDIKRSFDSLNSFLDGQDNLDTELDKLPPVISTIENMIAKTGTVEAIAPDKPKQEPQQKKAEIPSSLKYAIGNLSSIVDDSSMPGEVTALAKAFLGRIVSTVKTGGSEYDELIKNDSSEARGMLESVMQAMSRYNK